MWVKDLLKAQESAPVYKPTPLGSIWERKLWTVHGCLRAHAHKHACTHTHTHTHTRINIARFAICITGTLQSEVVLFAIIRLVFMIVRKSLDSMSSLH